MSADVPHGEKDMLLRNSPLPSTEQARGHSFTTLGKWTAIMRDFGYCVISVGIFISGLAG